MKKVLLFLLIFITTLSEVYAVDTKNSENWDKIFKKSDNVSVEKVYFKNRYGITLAGDLYIPKNIDKSKNILQLLLAAHLVL